MFTISPSVFSADIMDLRRSIEGLKGFEHLHIDIDDGNFVHGISFGMDVVNGVCACTDIPVDVHLEVLNPMDYADDLCDSDISMAVAHVEALAFPSAFLSKLHRAGKKTGLALNIKTPVSCLLPYIDQLDQVIVVSVEADSDGLIFRKGILDKVRELKKMLDPNTAIWVDGGVNKENLKMVIDAGADGVVIGRAIFKAEDPNLAYKELLETGRMYERERTL